MGARCQLSKQLLCTQLGAVLEKVKLIYQLGKKLTFVLSLRKSKEQEFEMAEKIIQFKAKKEIFDKAATKLACSDCKAVPKGVPIYQTIQGDVLCSGCKPKSKLSGIFRNSVLEDLLMSLPISCKYQKNGCPVVLQDREHLSYHEEDCECRDVLCSYQACRESIPANQFKNHSQVKHEFSLKENSSMITKMSENGMYEFKEKMESKKFQSDWLGTHNIIYNDSKSFLTHSRKKNGFNFIWIQLVGSKFEARNFEYSLKVEGLDIGEFNYKGTVQSLDDDKNHIFETGLGLFIPHGALKKLVQDDQYSVEVKIKDLKAELNMDEDSQIPMSDEDD